MLPSPGCQLLQDGHGVPGAPATLSGAGLAISCHSRKWWGGLGPESVPDSATAESNECWPNFCWNLLWGLIFFQIIRGPVGASEIDRQWIFWWRPFSEVVSGCCQSTGLPNESHVEWGRCMEWGTSKAGPAPQKGLSSLKRTHIRLHPYLHSLRQNQPAAPEEKILPETPTLG